MKPGVFLLFYQLIVRSFFCWAKKGSGKTKVLRKKMVVIILSEI